MTNRPGYGNGEPAELGALLVLLHEVDVSGHTVEATYRIWRHSERSHAAHAAYIEEQRRRGAAISTYAAADPQTLPAEQEETVRIWRDGERARVEQHGGPRDGYYAVADGSLWWIWDERSGARSNQDDPSVGSGVGEEMQIMLDPTPLLSSTRLQVTGTSQVADRPTISARATPRPRDPRRGPISKLYELGAGAQYYELEIDREFGVLLKATAIHDGQPFQRITTLAIRFDHPIAAETFHFEPPEGEQIGSSRSLRDRVQNVTLPEAQRRAPFTVMMPDTVPADWQVQCRLIEASTRPVYPMQISLMYRSVDGHESVSLTQMAVGAPKAVELIGDEADWEEVVRDGTTIKTRPLTWNQAQARLEREGTIVHLMSDNLTRDQLLTIASKLRAAPSTSII